MKSFNVITGLPRSGSTLLCNILNQNPEFYASSTSPLPSFLATMTNLVSQAPEVSSMLIHDKEKTNQRVEAMMRGIVRDWYWHEERHVFDKSRAWANNALLLHQLYPDALIIVTVRDLRSVFGSVEKQHQKNPVFDQAQVPQAKQLYTRAENMFMADGLIGQPTMAVEDLVRRRPKNVVLVPYETFCDNPQFTIDQIYAKMDGIEPFEHDFENVVNVAEDVDELYLGKFEHRGEGKVEKVDEDEWKKYVSTDIGRAIMDRYPFYNRAFKYT